MCNDEVAVVEYVVADEAVEEFCIAFAIFNGIWFELFEGFGKAISGADIFAL